MINTGGILKKAHVDFSSENKNEEHYEVYFGKYCIWIHFLTKWSVLGLRMEEMASIYGG
jgi:hypothetical protein